MKNWQGVLSVRLYDDERALLASASKETGVSDSEIVRFMVNEYLPLFLKARRFPPDEEE